MNTQHTIESVAADANVHTLSTSEQQSVRGGSAFTAARVQDRESEIRTAEIFRIEIE